MFEVGEDAKRPIKFMSTKVGSCDKITKLVLNSLEIRQQWHSTTT